MHKKLLILTIIAFALLQAQALALDAKPLSLTYSGGYGKGDSDSSFDENIWSYKYQYHILSLSGGVPQGKLTSQLQLDEMDYKTGLTYARLNFSGSTYMINLGDDIANFSDLTLNSVAYQGAGVTLRPSSNFSMFVVGGSRGNGLWGADVRRDTRAKDTFTGIKTVFYPGLGLGLSANYLTTQGGTDVFSYGGEYGFENLKLGAEYGSALEGKAFSGAVKYSDNWLTLGTVYRDIEPTYVVPFDYVSYKGMKGTYSTVGIRPSNNLAINVQSDSYLDRLNSSAEVYNLDTRGDVSLYLDSGTSLGYSGWRNDRQAYERGGITEGEIMYITQQFVLLTRNAIYYRNQPTWFDSCSPSEESYTENKNVAGLNISLFDFIRLNYEVENTLKIKNVDATVNPSAISTRADIFETQIMDSPFYLSGSVNYRKDIPDKDADEDEVSTSAYSDATLKYAPGPDMTCFITAKVLNLTAPDADRTAREQTDMSFGLKYTFNTDFYMK